MSGQIEDREGLLVESSDLTDWRGRRNASVYHQLFEVIDDHPFHHNPGGCEVCSTPHAATGRGVVWTDVIREDGPHTPYGYAHLAVSDAEWEASHRHVTVERLAISRHPRDCACERCRPFTTNGLTNYRRAPAHERGNPACPCGTCEAGRRVTDHDESCYCDPCVNGLPPINDCQCTTCQARLAACAASTRTHEVLTGIDPAVPEPAGAQLCLRCNLVASPTLPVSHVHVEPDPQSNRLYQQSAVRELTAEEYRQARTSPAAISQFLASYTDGESWRRAISTPFTAYRSDFYERWIERRPDWIERRAELAPGLEVTNEVQDSVPVRAAEPPDEPQAMNVRSEEIVRRYRAGLISLGEYRHHLGLDPVTGQRRELVPNPISRMEIGAARTMIEYAEADAEWARQLSARLADRRDRIDRLRADETIANGIDEVEGSSDDQA